MPGEGPVKGHSQSVPRPARSGPLSPQEQLEQSADSRRVQDKDPRAQPLPTLFHWPEAVHLGDLMRL
ncbi:unnamed protein product [Victoria cruziana]